MLKQSSFFISLCYKKEIALLFEKGLIYKCPFFKVIYFFSKSNLTNSHLPIKVLWSVPKRTGHAVTRNRLRRIAKAAFFEIFRFLFLQKILFVKYPQQNIILVFTPYLSFDKLDFKERIFKITKMLKDINYLEVESFNAIKQKFSS